MNKSTQSTQTALDPLIENVEFKNEYRMHQLYNLKEDTGADNSYRSDLNSKIKNSFNENDLIYLKKNWAMIDSKQKKSEIDTSLKQKRDELTQLTNQKSSTFDVFNKRVYEIRNPVVNDLIKDVRTNSGINQLADDLKREFDMFLTTTLTTTNESFKKFGKSEHLNNMKPTDSWTFLTQNEACEKPNYLEIFNNESFSEENNLHMAKRDKFLTSRNSSKILSGKTSHNKISKLQKLSENGNTHLQVALVTDKENEKNTSIIKLNKMLESIKRIDLPKFQPELHQICQYGSDAKLLDLYADVKKYYLKI